MNSTFRKFFEDSAPSISCVTLLLACSHYETENHVSGLMYDNILLDHENLKINHTNYEKSIKVVKKPYKDILYG